MCGVFSSVLASRKLGQRSVIRDLCAIVRQEREREKLLIEFKVPVASAATRERIAYGSERSDLISRLVGAFIEELYRAGR